MSKSVDVTWIIALLQAVADGKTLQMKRGATWEDWDIGRLGVPFFAAGPKSWRIKPREPQVLLVFHKMHSDGSVSAVDPNGSWYQRERVYAEATFGKPRKFIEVIEESEAS